MNIKIQNEVRKRFENLHLARKTVIRGDDAFAGLYTHDEDVLDFVISEIQILLQEQIKELEGILNRSRTERGLGIALANYIKKIKSKSNE